MLKTIHELSFEFFHYLGMIVNKKVEQTKKKKKIQYISRIILYGTLKIIRG